MLRCPTLHLFFLDRRQQKATAQNRSGFLQQDEIHLLKSGAVNRGTYSNSAKIPHRWYLFGIWLCVVVIAGIYYAA